jgi:hypothetical protein
VTSRIYEGHFKTRLRDISVSRRSSLTGLAILASYASFPREVLIELPIEDWRKWTKRRVVDSKWIAWRGSSKMIISCSPHGGGDTDGEAIQTVGMT